MTAPHYLEQRPLRQPESTSSKPIHRIDTLISGEGTLYGRRSTEIAALVGSRLNQEEAQGRRVTSIMPITDSSSFASADGGLRNMLVFTSPSSDFPRNWQTKLAILGSTDQGTNRNSMYHERTGTIEQQVSAAQEALEEQGNRVAMQIALPDYHTNLGTIGLYGGIKNVILCYYPEDAKPA